MKIVKYLAAKNCKVKINGVFYSGDKVIPDDVGKEEIKRLLAVKFIREITLDDGKGEGNGTGAGNGTGEKTLDQMSKEELKAEAEKLGVKVTFTDSEEKIRQKLKDAKGAGA
jgi:hypothetical protein